MNDQQIQEILWRALEAPCGLELEASDIETLKRKLYQVRAKAKEKGNDAFDCLQVITPPVGAETKIWLVKGQGNGRSKGDGGVRENTERPAVQRGQGEIDELLPEGGV